MLKEELVHLVLILIPGIAFSLLDQSTLPLIFALTAGFLIDIDHFFDYIIYLFRSKKAPNLKEFLSGMYFDYSGKVYVFFHGFEYALLILSSGFIFENHSAILFSAGLAMFLHLVFDTISNKPKLLTYSIIYRAYKRFDHKSLEFKKCQQ